MATVSPIQSHNATRLIFVYKSDDIGVEVYWPGACCASKEARRDVNDKSPIVDDGEKVEKKVQSVGDMYKSAEVLQIVSSVPADRRRLVTEALPTSKKLNSAD